MTLWDLQLWLQPGTILPRISSGSDAQGFARLPLPIPNTVQLPLGLGLQWCWLDPNGCGGARVFAPNEAYRPSPPPDHRRNLLCRSRENRTTSTATPPERRRSAYIGDSAEKRLESSLLTHPV